MNTAFLLSIIATTIEMAVCLISARQLWRLRAEAKDRSRWLLGLGALMSGVLAALALGASIGPGAMDAPIRMLNPWLGLVYMSMHIVMTLYPISVVKPDWLNPRRFFFLFLPVAVFFIAFLCFIGRWTVLEAPASVWENALKPDVFFRLASLFVMIPYCLILLLLPYNYRKSSASFWWIVIYCFGLSAICGVHIALMLSYNPVLLIILPLLASVFYLLSTEYELTDRLGPGADVPETVPDVDEAIATGLDGESPDFGLWTRVSILLDKEEAWRDPDLSLISLAHLCGTNVTYLTRIIKQETSGSFKDLINSKRINAVAAQLSEDPGVDIQTAFFNAGYRSRATAWRNFKDIMGVTPTEYRLRLLK